MPRSWLPVIASIALAVCALVAGMAPARAQDIEPRAYSNAPVGVNFLIAGYVYTRGGLSFDPSLPVTNEHLQTSNAVVAYATVLDLWGKSAKFDAIVPTPGFPDRPTMRDNRCSASSTVSRIRGFVCRSTSTGRRP